MAEKQLSDLVTNKTINLFEASNIQTNFSHTDPCILDNNEEFLNGKKKIESHNVMNDIAGR